MARGSPWAKSGANGLPASFFGPMSPQPKKGYNEVTLRGRRGRVLEDKGDTVVVELYATGEKETVRKEDVKIEWRETR